MAIRPSSYSDYMRSLLADCADTCDAANRAIQESRALVADAKLVRGELRALSLHRGLRQDERASGRVDFTGRPA